MCTSARKKKCDKWQKCEDCYLMVSLICLVFGLVYERFGHGVFSYYMIYAFVIPLMGGVVRFRLAGRNGKPYPDRRSSGLYHAGIATLTVGCLVKGILEIYGTTNRLILVYWIAGIVLCIGGCLHFKST